MAAINLLPHEHIVKNGRFQWKASCYKFKLLCNYEKCFNTDETWHRDQVGLDHPLCKSMLNRKFPVTKASGDVSNLQKITILHCFFLSNLISKCCNLSMNWDRKGFSVSVTSYHKNDMRSFLTSHMSKIFLTMRGTPAPNQTPKQKGAHPPSGKPPDVPFWWEWRR
jgi:hypothetical protein